MHTLLGMIYRVLISYSFLLFYMMKEEIIKQQIITLLIDKKLRGKIVGVANKITQNRADAEDSVQDATIHLLEKKKNLSEIKNVERFIIRAVINAAISYTRKNTTTLKRFHKEELIEVENIAEQEERDLSPQLRNILRMIPMEDAILFINRHGRGIKMKELCATYKCNYDTLKKRLQRIREKLLHILFISEEDAQLFHLYFRKRMSIEKLCKEYKCKKQDMKKRIQKLRDKIGKTTKT